MGLAANAMAVRELSFDAADQCQQDGELDREESVELRANGRDDVVPKGVLAVCLVRHLVKVGVICAALLGEIDASRLGCHLR